MMQVLYSVDKVTIFFSLLIIASNLSCFLQQVPYADAMNKTLVFAIFDFDRFSKHDQIGEVKVPLCQVDLAQTIEEWRELQGVEGEGGQVSRCTLGTYLERADVLLLLDYYLSVAQRMEKERSTAPVLLKKMTRLCCGECFIYFFKKNWEFFISLLFLLSNQKRDYGVC